MVRRHNDVPDSKVYGANMGPNWGRQDPGGSHIGPMIFAIWGGTSHGLDQICGPEPHQVQAV